MQRAIPVAAALLAWAFGLLDFTHDIELQTYDLRVAATARPTAPVRSTSFSSPSTTRAFAAWSRSSGAGPGRASFTRP